MDHKYWLWARTACNRLHVLATLEDLSDQEAPTDEDRVDEWDSKTTCK